MIGASSSKVTHFSEPARKLRGFPKGGENFSRFALRRTVHEISPKTENTTKDVHFVRPSNELGESVLLFSCSKIRRTNEIMFVESVESVESIAVHWETQFNK